MSTFSPCPKISNNESAYDCAGTTVIPSSNQCNGIVKFAGPSARVANRPLETCPKKSVSCNQIIHEIFNTLECMVQSHWKLHVGPSRLDTLYYLLSLIFFFWEWG